MDKRKHLQVGDVICIDPDNTIDDTMLEDNGYLWIITRVRGRHKVNDPSNAEPHYNAKSLATGATWTWFWDELVEPTDEEQTDDAI